MLVQQRISTWNQNRHWHLTILMTWLAHVVLSFSTKHETWNLKLILILQDMVELRHVLLCFFFGGGPKSTKNQLRSISIFNSLDGSKWRLFFLYDYQSRGEDVCQKGASSFGFLFPRWAPKISNTSTRWNGAFGNRAPVFYAPKKTPKRAGCAAIYPGGEVVCVCIYIYLYIYIYILDTNQKWGRKFSGSSWEEVGGWKGKFWNDRSLTDFVNEWTKFEHHPEWIGTPSFVVSQPWISKG